MQTKINDRRMMKKKKKKKTTFLKSPAPLLKELPKLKTAQILESWIIHDELDVNKVPLISSSKIVFLLE